MATDWPCQVDGKRASLTDIYSTCTYCLGAEVTQTGQFTYRATTVRQTLESDHLTWNDLEERTPKMAEPCTRITLYLVADIHGFANVTDPK